MALFQVPGWSVPSTLVPASKKRKRRASHSPDDLQSAQANLEKLVRMLGDDTRSGDSQPSKKKASGKARSQNNDGNRSSQAGKGGPSTPKDPSAPSAPKGKKNESKSSSTVTTSGLSRPTSKPSRSNQGNTGLTSMQKNMKESLGGARFR